MLAILTILTNPNLCQLLIKIASRKKTERRRRKNQLYLEAYIYVKPMRVPFENNASRRW